MGVEPTLDGSRVAPRLAKDWPEQTITNIRYQDHRFDRRVDALTINVRVRHAGGNELRVLLVEGEERELMIELAGP